MKKDWVRFEQLGQLYVEQVLVKMDIPIFFICINDQMDRFACLTIDDEIGQYIVKRVELNELIETLNNKITLYDLFKNGVEKNIYLTEYNFDCNIMNNKVISVSNISDDYLPKKGEYFELVNDEIKKYLRYLMSLDIQIETGWYSEHNRNYIINNQQKPKSITNSYSKKDIWTYESKISEIIKKDMVFNVRSSNFVA